MPFENVHGHEGLLTTVGDLLKWNENFVSPRVGTRALIELQQEPGRLNDGTRHTYAMGLRLDDYLGFPQVAHSGSTAGYRARLARYPSQRLSVAILCNVANATPDRYAATIANMFLGPVRLTDVRAASAPPPTPPQPDSRYTPARDDIEAYLGRYASEEADVVFDLVLAGRDLLMMRGTLFHAVLPPTSKDTFTFGDNTVKILRDENGAVTGFSLRSPRVFDLRFKKVNQPKQP